MKTVLLLMMIWSNGEATTAAALYPDKEACEARKAMVPQIVRQNNDKEKIKVLAFATACTPVQEAPKGLST